MTRLEEYFGPNAGYVADLFDRYQQDPASVDAETRAIFDAWQAGPRRQRRHRRRPPTAWTSRRRPAPPRSPRRSACSATSAPASIRSGRRRPAIRSSTPAYHGVDEDLLERLPGRAVGGPVGRSAPNAAVAIRQLRALYCYSTGYELGHVQSPEERAWLFEAIEERRFTPAQRPGRRARPARPPDRGLGVRAVPAPGVSRPDPLLGRGRRDDDPDAGRADRAGGPQRHALDLARDGPSRAAQRPGPRPRQAVRPGARRVRGARAGAPEPPERHHRGGWAGDVKYHAGGRQEYARRLRCGLGGHGAEPVPPGARGPGGAGDGARRRRGPLSARPPDAGRGRLAGRADPRRRLVHGPGHRRRDAEPLRAAGVPDGRHAPPDRQQPAWASPPARPRTARPSTPATWPRASRSRSSTSTPRTRSPAWRRCGWPWRTAPASARTS